MAEKDVIIFGIGEFAELVYYYLQHDSEYNVVAFTINHAYRQEDTFLGLPIIDFEDLGNSHPPETVRMFVAVGYNNLNKNRAKKCQEVKAKGYSLISYISSHAVVWPDLIIGDNCFVMESVIIQPFSKIGTGVIAWSGARITHNTVIGDYCFLAADATIGGDVIMGAYCFIGMNATLRDKIVVGESCLVGAGALLLTDAPGNSAYVVSGTLQAVFSSRLAKNFL